MSKKIQKPMFRIHLYDNDGDINEEGIWLCFGEVMVKVAEDIIEWNEFREYLQRMTQEIKRNMP